MLFFRNDYGQGCIPEIMEYMNTTNGHSFTGYGMDVICQNAKETIKNIFQTTMQISTFQLEERLLTKPSSSLLKPFEAVIACDTGHIATHETGAIEAVGHKVIPVNNYAGKINPSDIRKVFDAHMLSYEHMVYPKMVYISNATEYGTVYTLDELKNIRAVCDELGLYLMMDGARLGVALSTVDYTLNDLANICDVFYIGGTKNGALMGEAVVISNPELKPYFRFVMKQNGAMLAKGWLLGIQFLGLFEHDAFFGYAKQSVVLAQKIQSKLQELGYALFMKSDTNQIFVNVSKEQYQFLSEKIDFEIWEKCDDHYVIRFVTSWHTSEDEVNALITYLEQAVEKKEQYHSRFERQVQPSIPFFLICTLS